MRSLLAIGAAGVLIAAGTAGARPAAHSKVGVWLREWRVIPSTKVVPAGKVTFVVSNLGAFKHELVVIRTNRAPGSLAGTGAGASEAGSRGEVEELEPLMAGRLTLALRPGRY